jgi:urease accessory protein
MNKRLIAFCSLLAAFAPSLAWGHPGHGIAEAGGGFVDGLFHPLTGIDHLVALLLVGLCAGLVKPAQVWLLPTAFLAAMAAGFAAGAGAGASFAEAMIAASLIAFGLVAALRVRTKAALGLLVAMAFGYPHGVAHGIEVPIGALPVLFAMGFLTSSAAIQMSGLWLARRLPVPLLRVAGGLAAGLGTVLAVAG